MLNEAKPFLDRVLDGRTGRILALGEQASTGVGKKVVELVLGHPLREKPFGRSAAARPNLPELLLRRSTVWPSVAGVPLVAALTFDAGQVA
jgi:hypothetical protein